MKQLTCEMCGSTDLLKQDGVFVCQSCGCKYSVEEAKKLMVEGVVEVTGIVKVDQSDELKNLYEVARRNRKDGNNEVASRYYDMILSKDPSSWEANYYSVYCKSFGCTIANIQSAATSLANCFGSVLSLVKNAEQEDTIEERVTEIIDTSVKAAQMYANAALNSFKAINEDSRPNFAADFCGRIKAATNIYYVLAVELRSRFGEYKWGCERAIELCDCACRYIDPVCDMFRPVNIFKYPLNYSDLLVQATAASMTYSGEKLNATGALKEFKEKEQKLKEKEQQMENKKYWEEHKKEKQVLENELNSLTEKLNDLQSKVDAINDKNAPQIAELESKRGQQTTEEIERDKQKNLIRDLEQQRSSLGLFHGKEKKKLTEKIAQENSKLDSMQKTAEETKKIYIDQINNQLLSIKEEGSELRAEIARLSQRQSQIRVELTKNR